LCKRKNDYNKKKPKKNGWCDLLQIWNVASHYRQALPEHIFSDKRSWINECVKITALLFLIINSLAFAHYGLLGLHDTLPTGKT